MSILDLLIVLGVILIKFILPIFFII